MSKTENVWANPGGTPGMPICKIERGSEAWLALAEAFASDYRYMRIGAMDGTLKIKLGEDTWTWELDVEAPA